MHSLTGTVEATVNYPRLFARYMHEERAGMDCRVRKTNSDEFCMENKGSRPSWNSGGSEVPVITVSVTVADISTRCDML